MAFILENLYKELKDIRVYLIKIGPKRRQGNILDKKLSEASILFEKYNSWSEKYFDDVSKGNISSKDIPLIDNCRKKFEELYANIVNLCQSCVLETESKMDSFDLRTALNLLPCIGDDESSVKQLIDNIEYYESVLTNDECKKNLINFVIKSRLSQAAKLKLKSKYSSVSELILDMRRELLPQKSATAIQCRLQQAKQNDLTISDYGKLITEMFVDLTVSQANGDSKSYDVLKPLNEKFAIKKFADGLRNRRLSTIIAARNFSSLKDAVQAAQDEDTSSTSASGEILGMSKQYHNSRGHRGNFRGSRGFRGRYNNRSSSNRGQYRQPGGQQMVRPQTNYWRGQNRGRYNNRNFSYRSRGNRSFNNNGNVNVLNENLENSKVEKQESGQNLSNFFRE